MVCALEVAEKFVWVVKTKFSEMLWPKASSLDLCFVPTIYVKNVTFLVFSALAE